MQTVVYTGPARFWKTAARGGLSVERGERVEVGDDMATWLIETHEFERVDETPSPDDYPHGFGILAEDVPSIKDRIQSGAFDGQLEALQRTEAVNENRTEVIDAVESRQGESEANE